MPSFVDLTGRIFGRLTVVSPLQQRANGGVVWQCQCECGNTAVAVEINGQSHNNFKVRARDARKKEILTELGWQVFSFKNEEVTEDGERIAELLKRLH